MKRILSFIAAAMFATQAWGQTTFTIGNLKYTVTDETNNYVSVGKGLIIQGAINIQEKVTNPNNGKDYTVTSVCDDAFKNCSSLTSVTIPNSVTSIGSYAFYECRGLTTITIPNSVTSIGYDAFGVCSSLSYNTYDNAEYLGNSENPYVVLISMAAANITSCKINENCKVIYSWAFYYCSSLKSVSIPNSVISIGERTFYSCGMNSVTIPNSVTSIGEGAFSGCHSAALYCECEETSKPSGWSSNWDAQTKWGCKVIRTAANNAEYASITTDGENYAVKGDDGSLWYLAETTNGTATLTATAKEGYRFIKWEDDAEAGSTRTVDVTESKTYKAVFRPKSFVIDGLKYITNTDNNNVSVRANSNNLSGKIEIPDKVIYDDVEYTVASLDKDAFAYCRELTTVIIPNSVTNISESAFNGCSVLTSVTIGNSVTSIHRWAFNYCSELTSITIPNAVTSIDEGAFNICVKLKEINVESANTAYTSENGILYNINKTTIVRYPSGKTETTYTIPDGVTSIGNLAFNRCGELTTVYILNTVTNIGEKAFQNCSSLTSVTIGNSVKSIGENAFNECNCLTEINVESANSTYASENGVLFNKEKNELIRYPAGKTETTYNIPNGVTSISGYAFYGCNGLTSVTIPNSVTNIGNSAFYNSSGLTSICYDGGSEPTYNKSNSFANVDKTIPVCVPADYASDTWCGFTNLIKGHNKVTDAAVAATCTETGLTEGVHCSNCGRVFVAQEEISATGHTVAEAEAENYVAPTCTAAGAVDSVVYCAVCQSELNRKTVEIPATGHSYSTAVTAPTCTEVGFKTHNCTVCDYTYNSDTIAATGHKADSVEFENIIPATCTAAGSKDSVVFCSVCEVELSREERAIPALGHTEVTDAAVPATCTTAGKTEGKHCSICNAVLVPQEEIAALGHEFKTYTFDNNATTEADGTETATCERGCGATDTRTAAGTKIATTPEKGTAVTDAAANAISIYTQNNVIVVENAQEEISVYDAMGRLVCRDAARNVSTEITVTTLGIYIVKVGGTAKRVMVN